MSLPGWDTDKKEKLTFDSSIVDADLTDLVASIILSTTSGKTNFDHSAVFTALGANSKKIAFEIGDTGIQCYGEIVEWDHTGNFAHIEIKVPSVLAATDSFFNFYYDPTQPDNEVYIGDTGDEETSMYPVTLGLDSSSGDTITRRLVVAGGNLDSGAFRIKFAAHSTLSTTITVCYAGHGTVGGNAWDFDGDQVQVTFNDGDASVTIGAGETILSDPVPFVLDAAKILVISLYQAAYVIPYTTTMPTGGTNYYVFGSNVAADDAPSLSSVASWGYAVDIVSAVASDQVHSDRDFVSHQAQDPSGTSPQIIDSSPNDKNGTSYGSMTSGDLVDGLVGKALDYDNTDDYTNHGYAPAHNITDELTIVAVIKPSTTLDSGLTNNVGIVSRQNDPADSADTYALFINTDGKLQLDSASGSIVSTKASWTSGVTYVVAATYNATGLVGDLFVDGVKETLTVDNLDTMAGSTNNLVIGKNADASEFFPGTIDEVIIINDVMSDAWHKAHNAALRDNLITFSIFVVPSTSAGSSGGQPVVLPTVRQLVDMPYSLMDSIRVLVNLLYGMKLAAIVNLRYGDLTELRKITNLKYGDLSLVRRIIDVLYGDLSRHRNLINIDYDLMAQVRGLVNMPYHMIQGELRNLVDIDYDLQLRDFHKNIVNIIYAIANGDSIDEITTLSIINEDGYELNPFHIDIEKDEGDPCIRIEVRSNDENDFVKNPVKKMVQVTVNSDTYVVLVEDSAISTEISEDGQQLVDTYSIIMKSPCFLLDDPYADLLTEELSGMASAISEYVAGTVQDFYIYGIDYGLLDWYIPAGTFIVNDMTPIAILEKLAAVCGGILQSKKDGTLELRPEYPTNIPDYETETPSVFLTDQENFYSVSSTTERYKDYNNFLVGDIEPDVSGLDLRSETISSTIREVRVFQVPFDSDDTIQLQTSGGGHVKTREYGTKNLLIEDEEVEIVDGEGTTANPIYGLENYQYSESDLGTITATEDKTINTAVKENTIAKINYYTKYRKFTVEDEKIENVQFWPEII